MDSVFLSEWWACISLEPSPKQLKQRQMMNDLARSALLFKLYLDDEEERTWMAILQALRIPRLPPQRLFFQGSAAPSFEIAILDPSLRLELDHRLFQSSATVG